MPVARVERKLIEDRGLFDEQSRVYKYSYRPDPNITSWFRTESTYPRLKIVSVSMNILSGLKWYQKIPLTQARYVGFFDPSGVVVAENWDTGNLNVKDSSQLKEYLGEFEREVDEYVRQCGLVRSGLPKID